MKRQTLFFIGAMILFGLSGFFLVEQPVIGVVLAVIAIAVMVVAGRIDSGQKPSLPRREAPPPPEGYRDVSMPIEDILQSASGLALALFLVPLAMYIGLYGVNDLLGSFTLPVILLALPVTLLAIVLHELIHAIGWVVFGRFSWRAMSFGIDRATLSPYAHADVPMKANAYRIGAALPGILTGLLPLLYGLAIADGAITTLGAFMTSAAVGDLAVLWAIREVAGDAQVLDHPTNAGCFVKV